MLPNFEASLNFAQKLDQQDPLAHYKNLFHFPQHKDQPAIYFCCNCLGLQPKSLTSAIRPDLNHFQ